MFVQGGEDDIDALLAQFKLKDAQAEEVGVLEGRAPSPRVYASFIPLPSLVHIYHRRDGLNVVAMWWPCN